MECLTPSFSFHIFMDNYFTSLRLLTHLGVNNSRATCVLNKNSLRKFTIIGDKRGVATWNREHQAKKQCNFTVVGQNDSSAIYIGSSKSCEPKRFVPSRNKVEKNIFKNNNQISSTVTVRTWVLSTIQYWYPNEKMPSTGIQMKKWWRFPFF